ncbi:MAG: glycosyltransferase family 4 protein [Dehalococcoidia bacterium]|jgi:glycosyltransferase involved in cell wall biosynthesis
MRILQLAPLWETVPPPAYGGTEAVVSVLCEELVRRGHDVTLCASGDSVTSAELLSIYPRSLRTAFDLEDPEPLALMHAGFSLKDAASYDIVHNHIGEPVMAMSHLVDTPMLTTMHCLITPYTKFIWDHYEGWYNTISRSEKQNMPEVTGPKYAGVVYNGIDVASFPYQEEKDDYLLFLSRVSPDKSPHLAVEVARRLGREIVIAGKVDHNPIDTEYFSTMLEPLIDGKHVHFVGEADARQKRKLFAGAYCLLMPLNWEEPFGLVMVEAMACGTPVVAFPRGAASEVIVDGETGFLVNDVDEMVKAVLKVDRIDHARCRRHVEQNFSPESMADDYLRVYKQILRRAATRPTLTALTSASPLTLETADQEAAVA